MRTVAALAEPAPSPLRDAGGFLIDGADWDRDLARALARETGIGALGEHHWAVIDYLRERHRRSGGAIPTIRQICRASDLQRAQIKRLFGGCLNVWRVAGLPDPGEEVRAYMS